MSSAVAEPGGGVGRYRSLLAVQPPGHDRPVDELSGPDGIRGHRAALGAALDSLRLEGLRSAQAEARRRARRRVTYGAKGADRSTRTSRRWEIDPVPVLVSAADWAVEAGLEQRALPLDRVLGDLYGEQRLLREGVVPPAVVYGQSGFVHQAVGIGSAPQGRLVLTATDLGRGIDGRWQVLADRDETPAGGRLRHGRPPDHQPGDGGAAPRQRHRPAARFFDTMTRALQEASVTGSSRPRIVLLSARRHQRGCRCSPRTDHGSTWTRRTTRSPTAVTSGRRWGRDFADVSPLKGVVFTEGATSRLSVGIDVTRLS